jgi:hypothetical protein
MKNLSIFVLALMVMVLLTTIESHAGGFGKRYSDQDNRIDAGIARGDITQREARILRNDQERICELRERALRDGRLSEKERMMLERRQNMADRRFHHFNNNRAERRDRHHFDRDHISFRKSSVMVPIILPPLPPPPIVFPGMHILFHHSSR